LYKASPERKKYLIPAKPKICYASSAFSVSVSVHLTYNEVLHEQMWEF